MFTTDLTIVDLKIRERNLYKAIFSMNFHQVATPELGVDEARCYIFFFREKDKFSAYIVLYMPNSERRLFYTYSSNPFPEADLPLVENIARSFGEEMGFFLDEKSFASSSSAEKNLWIDEQPLFGFKTPEELALAEAVRMAETAAALEAEQPPAPTVVVDIITEAPASPAAKPMPEAREYQPPPPAAPAAKPMPEAREYQPPPVAPAAQPMPAAPVYQQAPAQPDPTPPQAAPVYYQPAPTAPPAQPQAAPVYYQPAPTAPPAQPQAAPVYYQPAPAPVYYQPAPAPVYYQPAPPAQPQAAPVYYQPAPPAPAAPQTPPQPRHQKEIELEPQVEVEVEVDVRPPRQKNAAVPRSSTEKAKAAGAAPRTARPVQSDSFEGEHRAAQKTPAPKQQVKKETHGATDLVSREMEALARLMASF